MLPAVLFSNVNKAVLTSRINEISVDHWSYTVMDLKGSWKKKSGQHAGDVNKTVEKLISKGQLGKAMNYLSNNLPPSCLGSEAIVDKLLDKHPHMDWSAYEALINDLKGNMDTDVVIPEVDKGMLRSIIRKTKLTVRPGLDKLRYEHVKTLAGYSVEPAYDEDRFCELLAQVLTIILRGQTPPVISALLSDNELIALPKSDTDIRPIGIGSTLRKLAALVVMNRLQSFNKKHFSYLQYGMKSNGMEQIIHNMRVRNSLFPDFDVFCMDADNAFNRANRLRGLEQVMLHFPEALPFLREMYLHSTDGWFSASPDLYRIGSNSGYHQGAVLASWLFNMTIQPFLRKVREEIREFCENDEDLSEQFDNTFMGFYIDDGNIIAPREIMARLVKALKRHGPEYGFHIKPNKGAYLLASFESAEEAQRVKGRLCQVLGLSEDIVHLHPNNSPDTEYGTKILGSYLGSDEFISTSLEKNLAEIQRVADQLIAYPDLQGRLLLFRKCFLMKPVHLFRTMPPSSIASFIDSVESIKRSVVCSIFDYLPGEIPEVTWKTFDVAIDKGGLGLRHFSDIAKCSFIASLMEEDRRSWRRGDISIQTAPHIPLFEQYRQCVNSLHLQDEVVNALEYSKAKGSVQHQLQIIVDTMRFEELKLLVTDVEQRTWWENHFGDESGAWLNCIPKYANFQMPSGRFRTALRYRYRLKAVQHIPGSICKCNRPLDCFGHHLATGCNHGGERIATHDSIKFEVHKILQYAGKWSKVEDHGVFHNTNPDSKLRPDIIIRNPVGSNTSLHVLDVAVCGPIRGEPGKALTQIARSKTRKYGSHCTANGFSFTPLIIESSGLMHSDFLRLLKQLASSAAETRRIPSHILLQFFVRRISMRLAMSIAEAIDGRYSKLNSHSDLDFDPGFSSEVILGVYDNQAELNQIVVGRIVIYRSSRI